MSTKGKFFLILAIFFVIGYGTYLIYDNKVEIDNKSSDAYEYTLKQDIIPIETPIIESEYEDTDQENYLDPLIDLNYNPFE